MSLLGIQETGSNNVATWLGGQLSDTNFARVKILTKVPNIGQIREYRLVTRDHVTC